MNNEQIRKSMINRMTTFTHGELLEEVEKAKDDVAKSLLRIGEAAGTESDWHDNAAFDLANMQHDVNTSKLSSIEKKLKDIQIIEPSKNTDSVGVGNSVIVKFDNVKKEELFTVLGPADSGRKDRWISFESPLGSNLIGKKIQDEITLTVDRREQKVKIIDILPGNF